MRVLNAMKTFAMVAALLAGGTTLAMAQNGLPTGDETPVAGGANGGGITYGTVYGYPNTVYGYPDEFQPTRNFYAYQPSRAHRHRY
jgi:hypothetical protein